MKADSWLLVYDESCSLCRNFAALASRWDSSGKLEKAGYSDPRVRKLAQQISRETLQKSFHVILPDGSIRSEAAALTQIFRLLPAGRPVAWLLENLPGSGLILRGMLRVIGDMRR